ncbi:LacI family DNA-binding transcriptional regulator [Dactylosporangium sp. AC04546]|uniref:LacI family DNA-binding transcriptional regulator n=1 Tax=Dactylosporangium sp. AC04546 TaxID=2862460 RepID=UPI001EE09121|nr:LacI family DNA-binding transcriptional regulator [Dactylosporangium sp. AC04546]WVK81274.1 LacI family DNA-binding transcriptional regulator [Dactylosporangium sp. AC04546]
MAAGPSPRRATITDVANLAQVSPAAVSKVLRNAYGVSPAMQERVRAAMAELGYRPHAAARGMRGQTYTIGVLIPDLRNPFFPELIEGIGEHLDGTDYQTVLGPGGSTPETQSRTTDALVDRRVDGLVMIAPALPRTRLEQIARTVPVVVIGRHGKSAEYDGVVDDDLMGAGLVVDHLADLGHRRIAHIEHRDTTRGIPTTMPQTVRAEGYRQAMERRGLAAEIDIVPSTYSEAGGYSAALELLARPVRPTAVFAGADVAAIGVLNAVHEAGLRIPEDLSVAGYDNTTVAAMGPISLTSVDQDGHLMGANAARLLLERIERKRDRSVLLSFSPTLVPRRSTAPPLDA